MSDGELPSRPAVLEAKNVITQQDGLAWDYSEGTEQVTFHELLFVLGSSTPGSSGNGYIICALRENANDEEHPFQLVLARATSVPSQILSDFAIGELPRQLAYGNTRSVDVVVSTKSGTGGSMLFWQSVLEPLLKILAKELGRSPFKSYNILITESKNSVFDYAKHLGQAGSSKHRTIILVSGDGGAIELLNGSPVDAAEDSVPPLLCLLPLGTGNGLFHSLHKPVYTSPGPSPLVCGLRTLFRGVEAYLPVFRASFSAGSQLVGFTDEPSSDHSGEQRSQGNTSIVARQETTVSHLLGTIVASYGFHANIVYESDTPEYRVYGSKRFGMVAEELLHESHPYAAQVDVRRHSSDFEPIHRRTHAYVLATMVSNLERTFTISPASRPLDKQLRLVHFAPIGGERTMEVMMKAYDEGKHIGMKWDDGEEVGYEEVEAVRVTILEDDDRWRKVCIDGAIVEIPKGGQMTIEREETSKFKILVDSRVAHAADKF